MCPPDPPPEPPPTRFRKIVFSPPPPVPPRARISPWVPKTTGPRLIRCSEPPPPPPPAPFSSPVGEKGGGKLCPIGTSLASPPPPPPAPAQGFLSSPCTSAPLVRSIRRP